jgi:hypothetical protein
MVRFALLASICCATWACSQKPQFPYENPKLGVDKRTEDLLARMTPDEKQEFLKTGHTIARLGVPAIPVSGQPVHDGLALEATWNPAIAGEVAPLRSSAFGYFGEDPWLASRMAVAWVSAVQGAGRIAEMTDFSCGGDPRTRNEIEWPPFRAAVEEAGLWSIGTAACPDTEDLVDRDWGFRGYVLPAATDSGSADDEARRRLRPMFAEGLFDPAPVTKTSANDTNDTKRTERIAAEQAVVLLRNDNNLLPLYATRLKSIAVTGSKDQIDAIRRRVGATPIVDGPAEVSIVFTATAPVQLASNTIVVLTAPKPPNIKDVKAPALLEAWSDSKDAAQAATDIVFGDVNPSGKLPITFPKTPVNDHEGIYVGYRYFDKHNIEPLFPFGFGLSYTTFDWTDLRVLPSSPRYGQTVQVIVKVQNTGARFGAETVELYVHQVKSTLERPPKELKAFGRVELKPGESKDVALTLDRRSMSFYDPALKDWATEPGVFEVLLGSSSRDIRLKGSFQLYP